MADMLSTVRTDGLRPLGRSPSAFCPSAVMTGGKPPAGVQFVEEKQPKQEENRNK
jgi:hypothetical protein